MILIKNLRVELPVHPWDFKVDRTVPVGNTFVMRGEKERDLVCDMYQEWFNQRISEKEYDIAFDDYMRTMAEALKEYGILNLFCWCHPKRCHAETIKNYLEPE